MAWAQTCEDLLAEPLQAFAQGSNMSWAKPESYTNSFALVFHSLPGCLYSRG